MRSAWLLLLGQVMITVGVTVIVQVPDPRAALPAFSSWVFGIAVCATFVAGMWMIVGALIGAFEREPK